MSRIRTIKPGFWTDGKIVKMGPWARLLYIGSWNFALCDDGHLPDDLEELKLKVLPADPINIEEVAGELFANGRFVRHVTTDGRTYIKAKRLRDHQKTDQRWQPRCPYCAAEKESSPIEAPRNSPELPESHQNTTDPAETPWGRKGREGKEGKESTLSPSAEPLEGMEDVPSTPPQQTERPLRASDIATDDPKWLEFWSLYPRKDGRAEGFDTWCKHVTGTGTYNRKPIPQTDPDVIIAGVRRYAERMQREGKDTDKIKMVQGWLNSRRWEDEPEPLVPAHANGSSSLPGWAQ